ncbi:heat shock protein 105 kDa-like isoform X1 [Zophobas morio]|uniref:heat shock protein 105 kDa-like isoform X1 n=2 Tax=Zophobas morio TaxID=2755281 RepID=UPI003083905A
MAAAGIDFGNFQSVLAAARSCGVEALLNEFSSRLTPCLVHLSHTRCFGENARTPSVTRSESTVSQFKRIIGLKYNNDFAKHELSKVFYKHSELSNGGIGIHLSYQGEEVIFTPEQVCAMFFTKLKETIESELKKPIGSLVVSCPVWFNQSQRLALQNAWRIAGLSNVRVFNETAANALAYGIYRSDLSEDQSHRVVFIDFGHAGLQIVGVDFFKRKFNVIGAIYDPHLGGRDIDDLLCQHFANEFQKKTGHDILSSPRATLKLKAECEKLKKTLSINSQTVPISVDELYRETDFNSSLNRADFERMCEPFFDRVSKCLLKTLNFTKIEEIHAVEIVGGSSRIPAFKNAVAKIFQQVPRSTLNADESVAKGCAWQATFYSPLYRARDFKPHDILLFAIELFWKSKDKEGNPIDSRAIVVEANQTVPITKILTFKKSEDFEIKACYADPSKVISSENQINTWLISNVKPNANGEDSTVKVKMHVGLDGVFEITEAYSVEEVEVSEPPQPEASVENEPNSATSTPKLPKKVVRNSLCISPLHVLLPDEKLAEYINLEAKMRAFDTSEKERVFVKNSVEELCYDLRGKIEGAYRSFVDPNSLEGIVNKLSETVDWLYDTGADCEKKIYDEKLNEIKAIVDPITRRYIEAEQRLELEANMRALMLEAKDLIRLYSEGNEKYDHLTEEEVQKLSSCVNEHENWLEENVSKQASLPLHVAPVFSPDSIASHLNSLRLVVDPLMNKPKPQKPVPESQNEPEGLGSNSTDWSKMDTDKENKQSSNQDPENMDVDSK